MSDHSLALVPIETWSYASPELRAESKSIDVGLFAEALIYYDRLLISPGNQPQFAEYLRWFAQQDRLMDFLALVDDGTIGIYEYSFISAPVELNGSFHFINLQDELQARPGTFEQRFLYHPTVEVILPQKARHRQKFYETLRNKVIEVKADEFGSAISNAAKDHFDPKRSSHIVQAFVDELYNFRKLGRPPQIEATVHERNGNCQITWNIDFKQLAGEIGKNLNFHVSTPLAAAATSNRFIWSAAQLNCDLYLPKPMSILVGDKLYESAAAISKTGNLIEELKSEVEFPDIRQLVNLGKLSLADVLIMRKRAQRFRTWLQSESDRDRNAIIAYHNEVGHESGVVRGARKTLSLFGTLGSPAAGALISTAIVGPGAEALGATAGAGIGLVADIASKFRSNWRPVVFGHWMKSRIEKLLRKD